MEITYYNYVRNEVAEREWDEPAEKSDSPLAQSCHEDNTNICDYSETEDYEQDEIEEEDEYEDYSDKWDDLGCSWRDFI